MSIRQAQLVRWSLPAFALILGLLWYKRRRVDRVDPGGVAKSYFKGDLSQSKSCTTLDPSSPSSNSNKTATATVGSPKSPLCSNSDSGIQTDDSRFDTSTPVEESISPRKVSESLDIPNRKSSAISMSLLSNNTPWYDDVEPDTPEMREIQLGSNPGKSGFDLLSKSKSKNSSIIEEDDDVAEVPTGPAKVVVANKHSPPAEFKVNSEDTKSPRGSDRDSANYSPVSVEVLEGSVNDEARSEGSTDSGKGGSIRGISTVNRTMYDFVVPLKLVGKLIGRGGRFLQRLKSSSGVYSIVVKQYGNDRDSKICSIDGTPESIQVALTMIRQAFPEKNFPHFTLEQIAYEGLVPLEEARWSPESLYLSLVEGVNNDVIVSNIVEPNHFFIQLPTHPTYPLLCELDMKMTHHYDTVDSPAIPDELHKGMILVAKWCERWVRVVVEDPDPNKEVTLVRMADYGGFYRFNHTQMRKIKYEFLTLPFQALEVFLANIQPKQEWSKDAYTVASRICRNIVAQAQIEAYVDSATFISLYFELHKFGVISLADELIARGLADPITFDDAEAAALPPQEVVQPAVV